MRVLVTGASGFVGSHLVTSLLQGGCSVAGFDLGGAQDAGRTGLHSIAGDIRQLADLLPCGEGLAGIIHLAAVSRSGLAEQDPYETIRTNILGTTNVLELAVRSPSRPWVIVASSRAVHDYEAGLSANQEGIYTLSKDVADRLLRYYTRRYGVFGLSLRFSDIYGSVELTTGRLLTQFLLRALKNEPLEVHQANMPFDFIHFEDVVRGIQLSSRYLERRQQQGGPGQFQAFSLASGRHITAEILAQIVCRTAGARSEILVRERTTSFPPLIDYTQQAFDQLGFRAQISLEGGLTGMIDRLRSAR